MNRVNLVPYHHPMMRTQVADGRDGLQIWKVVGNILNNHLGTKERGWSSSLGGGWGSRTSQCRKLTSYVMLYRTSVLAGCC